MVSCEAGKCSARQDVKTHAHVEKPIRWGAATLGARGIRGNGLPFANVDEGVWTSRASEAVNFFARRNVKEHVGEIIKGDNVGRQPRPVSSQTAVTLCPSPKLTSPPFESRPFIGAAERRRACQ